MAVAAGNGTEIDIASLEVRVDDFLDKLEINAAKHGKCLDSYVSRERIEIDLLTLIGQVRDLLQELVKGDDRTALLHVLGKPYTRLARIRYLLDVVPLSEQHATDSRWTDLSESCDIVESVLKDVDGAGFRDWRGLQRSGLFTPAFADPDAGSEDGHDDEEAGDSRIEGSPRDCAENGDSTTSAQDDDRGFAQQPCGRHAQFIDHGGRKILTRLQSTEDRNALVSWLDDVAMKVEPGRNARAVRNLHYFSRKLLVFGSESGCTAMSALPIRKFAGLGQYAEVRVEAARDGAPLGCLGVGITPWSPEICKSQYKLMPKRVDRFQGPSWIFTGPYRGITRRLYINGRTSKKFLPREELAQWQTGDVAGIWLQPDGKLSLYQNGECIISMDSMWPQDSDLQTADLWLVVEAYGYVLAVSMVPDADPRRLEVATPAPSTDPTNDLPLMRRLSTFLGTSAPVPKPRMMSLKTFLESPVPSTVDDPERT